LFQIFGSIAYAKKLGSLQKLDERNEKLYFVGYASNGYVEKEVKM